LLVDAAAGRLNESWLAAAGRGSCAASSGKRDVIVVSSGSIALGRAVLKLPDGRSSSKTGRRRQPWGQIALARTWTEALSRHGITAGQILVTLGDTAKSGRR